MNRKLKLVPPPGGCKGCKQNAKCPPIHFNSLFIYLSLDSYSCVAAGAQAGRNNDLKAVGLWELSSERSQRRRRCSFKQLFTHWDTWGGRMTGSAQESTFGWFSRQRHSPVFILHLNRECLTHPWEEAGRVGKQRGGMQLCERAEPKSRVRAGAKHNTPSSKLCLFI